MAEHVTPPRTYLIILVALLVLTAVTVGISRLPLSPDWHLVIGLTIAVGKAMLVLLFFMHLLRSPQLVWLVALGALMWLAILIFLTMNDYLTRDWYPRVVF